SWEASSSWSATSTGSRAERYFPRARNAASTMGTRIIDPRNTQPCQANAPTITAAIDAPFDVGVTSYRPRGAEGGSPSVDEGGRSTPTPTQSTRNPPSADGSTRL